MAVGEAVDTEASPTIFLKYERGTNHKIRSHTTSAKIVSAQYFNLDYFYKFMCRLRAQSRGSCGMLSEADQ